MEPVSTDAQKTLYALEIKSAMRRRADVWQALNAKQTLTVILLKRASMERVCRAAMKIDLARVVKGAWRVSASNQNNAVTTRIASASAFAPITPVPMPAKKTQIAQDSADATRIPASALNRTCAQLMPIATLTASV